MPGRCVLSHKHISQNRAIEEFKNLIYMYTYITRFTVIKPVKGVMKNVICKVKKFK